MTLLTGRHCYNALNPLHSMIYFAPEAEAEFHSLGLSRGSMSYFAGRSAAMGRVGAGTVAATFYNFSPALIARYLPRAWDLATPDAVLAARLRAVEAAQQRTLGAETMAGAEVREAAELALRAAEACTAAGRPLYAAHAELPVPTEPHLALWHAITLLREHRGDGHLAALLDAELDGLEALVTHTATGRGFLPAMARSTRGWSDEEWSAAEDRLRGRGLLDADGALTDAGRQVRQEIEDRTDRLAEAPYRHLGEAALARLGEIAARLSAVSAANGAFPEGVFAFSTTGARAAR
ncbi:SCO6745 family protein [Kitasatospora sp. NBC_01266]|uniref:SCO6745 family protein n=1 Tax=Kitasatospora sp. NBC_01266 TaxID=2903572 RepID=UPI002E346652|nr:hypothetical protein [Kitasatospora sp. NBC_01266]